MKLTDKILKLFLTSICICMIGFINFTFDSDSVVPNPEIEGDIVREINISNFDEIDLRGNRFNVDINRSDTFGIKIKGPDNLIDNYLSITKDVNKLLFKVSPEIKDSYYEINLTISLPKLIGLSANNLEHPLFYITNNSANEPAVLFFGRIEINLNNLIEDDLHIEAVGETEITLGNANINNLYVTGNNLSQIYILKSNINKIEYDLSEISSMEVSDFEGDHSGKLSDFALANFSDNKGNEIFNYSENFISETSSFGEVFPGLKWGSSREKVSAYLIDKGMVIDTTHIYPKSRYGMSYIIFICDNFEGLSSESVSANFTKDNLYHFQIGFNDSVSTSKIESWLKNKYGEYETEKDKSKTWIVRNDEEKPISIIKLHFPTKKIMLSSQEWSDLQYKMYMSNRKILAKNFIIN